MNNSDEKTPYRNIKINGIDSGEIHKAELREEEMRQKREKAEEAAADNIDGNSILSKIHARIRYSVPYRKYLLVRDMAIASCILLVMVSTFAFRYNVIPGIRGEKIVYTVNTGMRSFDRLTLPDGTTVKLGASSKIVYNDGASGRQREVWLEGQAYFNIARDRKRPFVVHAPSTDITALGTAFEVFTSKGRESEVVMLEGKVKVDLIPESGEGAAGIHLTADQRLSVSQDAHYYALDHVEAVRYIEWRDYNGLCFNDMDLTTIVPRLEKWYGKTITYDPRRGSAVRFTFKVTDEPLERILTMMCQSAKIDWESDGERFDLIFR